jgi:hypothetical protein
MRGGGNLWTDDELRISVEAYLFLLRLERAGLNFPMERLEQVLQEALERRNDVSVRFRLRNISDVLAKTGRPFLAAYPPAENVGTGVRRRINAMLDEVIEPVADPLPPPLTADVAQARADQALQDLQVALNALSEPKLGMGHNNPPEALDSLPQLPELDRAIRTVEGLREELAAQRIRDAAIRKEAIALAAAGVSWKVWWAKRGAKAADVAIGAVVVAALALLANAIIALLHLMPLL